MESTLKRETPQIAEVMQVIHTLATRGAGTNEDPVRYVHQYWSFDGRLLAESDQTQQEYYSVSAADFASSNSLDR
jgi:hypothetical protein